MSFQTAGKLVLFGCMLALAATGCSPQQQAAVDLSEMEVEADAPSAPLPPQYGVGTVLVGDLTINGETQRVTDTIVEKVDRDGRTLDLIEHSIAQSNPGFPCDGATHQLWDAATHNWVGCLSEGAMLAENQPHAGRYAWPLQVGNKWRWKPRWVDHVMHPDWSGSYWADYEVLAHEEVTVPAGTFMAFKVATTGTHHDDWHETNWYAPKAGITVKGVWGRTDKNGYGAMAGQWELVSIEGK